MGRGGPSKAVRHVAPVHCSQSPAQGHCGVNEDGHMRRDACSLPRERGVGGGDLGSGLIGPGH